MNRAWQPALAALLGLSCEGCILHVRQAVGVGRAPAADDHGNRTTVPITTAVAFGALTERTAYLATFDGTVSPAQDVRSSLMAGVEVDHDVTSGDRPWGPRVRLEGGTGTASIRGGSTVRSAQLGLVPGVWFLVAGSRIGTHRFVVAVEPEAILDLPTEGPPRSANLIGALSVSLEWHAAWLPCTMLGGPTCTPGPDGGGYGWAVPPERRK